MPGHPRVGAHCGGGLSGALTRAQEIGAECLQVFASAPQQWRSPAHTAEDIIAFCEACAAAGIGPLLLHGIYLLNFASPVEANLKRSIGSLRAHLEWADLAGAIGVVFHPGSAGADPYEEAERRVVGGLADILAVRDGPARVIIETCAGQGATIGRSFEEIARLLGALNADRRVGVCIDTCHLFAAGYDLVGGGSARRVVDEFDRIVGLDRLVCIHANDSRTAKGSNVDRHANIGDGQIGEDVFHELLTDPRLRHVPFYLEVPGSGDGPDRINVDALKRLRGDR
ncbi:MAG: deoxyribonuclease IV [Chloroflexi bacterium]|nr:deoxyribonuclease IV [Chloroflexota bacterium]